jgi:hypothetical protein
MPRAKWMSDSDFAAFERCLKDVKTTGNKYAICMSSIKHRKKKRDAKHSREALKRVKK